jgi:hypothetical protein
MNKGKFTGLIFMMLFSIIGIIWVQLKWIKNAIGIRNENFDYYVNASIRDAANAIESSRKMSFINDFMFPESSSLNDTSTDITSYIRMGSYSSDEGGNFSVRITNQSVTQSPGKDPVVITHDTIYTTDSAAVIMTSPDDPGKMVIVKSGERVGNNSNGVYIRQKEFIEWAKKRKSIKMKLNLH